MGMKWMEEFQKGRKKLWGTDRYMCIILIVVIVSQNTSNFTLYIYAVYHKSTYTSIKLKKKPSVEKLQKTTLGPHPLCFTLWWNVSEWVGDEKGFQLLLVTRFSLTEMLIKDRNGHGPWISLDSSHGFRSNNVADLSMAFIKIKDYLLHDRRDNIK